MGREWECVELVMRYMYLVYGIAPYSANGDSVVSNYSGSVLTQVSNNATSMPSPGDIVSWAGTEGIRNDMAKAMRAAGLWYHDPVPRPAAARVKRAG